MSASPTAPASYCAACAANCSAKASATTDSAAYLACLYKVIAASLAYLVC